MASTNPSTTTTNSTTAGNHAVGAEAGQRAGIPPPPAHPSSTSMNNATPPALHHDVDPIRDSVGNRVRGFFSAVHGAGEALRGSINSGLDGLGDGIAGRPTGSAESRTSAQGEESVASKGVNEFQQGLNALTGKSSTSTTGSTTHPTSTI